MGSPTSKVYVKWTCTETHAHQIWYSDSGCSTPIDLPVPYTRSLSCSAREPGQGTYGFYMETYACNQSYPAARWSRYTDSTCSVKDETKKEEIIPLNFCRASGWENDNNGKRTSCGSSGLETSLWQKDDCTGSSEVKSDSDVSVFCKESTYYGSYVKVESGCDGNEMPQGSFTSKDASSSTSNAMMPVPILL